LLAHTCGLAGGNEAKRRAVAAEIERYAVRGKNGVGDKAGSHMGLVSAPRTAAAQ